ncbi:MAG: hypothetical protein ABI637_02765 [Gemmatimonadota bacterium]
MDPQVAFMVGALVASVKGLGLLAIGAGVGWWRARRRIRELEGQLLQVATDARGVGSGDAERLEQGLDYLATQVQALAEEQRQLVRHLPPGMPPRE